MAAKSQETEISVAKVDKGIVTCHILGTSPIILNRMSEKVRQELLLPKGRKTAAEKIGNLKHDPLREFRSSPYTNEGEGPTYLQLLSSMFKKAMMTAALDIPGARKSQIGRLVYVEGDRVDLFGVPQIFLSVTRSADMNRTPDVRSRAILPRWAAIIRIAYVKPMINETSVLNLLSAGGITAGIGDWRVEKGSGSYGQYILVDPDDADFRQILEEGREKQIEALQNPEPYDDETKELLGWFDIEVQKRGLKPKDVA